MTWGEFKAAVEAKGVTDATEVFAIDVSGWSLTDVEVKDGADSSVWILNGGAK